MRLCIEKMDKSFDRDAHSRVRAVCDFSAEIETGELVALVGPNGCGKTTLANLLAGSLIADGGKIVLDSVDITSKGPRDRTFVGRVYQDPRLGSASNLTGKENLCLSQIERPHALKPAITHLRLRNAFDELRRLGVAEELLVEGVLSANVDQLSGGERQLLNLAMLCVRKPPPQLVLADEPAGGLDPMHAEKCFEILRSMAQDRAVLLITHNLAVARRCPRVWVMCEGRLVVDVRLPEGVDVLDNAARAAYRLD